ncbi:MAG: GNAT family N-acetyltransferase [Clostridia bacterium]|jgi:diamine N-acetyltransferase|nr:GNAT family N-acetyltransferase [Clostridia bacterium]MBT7121876.1 GNAT family N-acetyltransferase [Clostridia bacterium]
MADIIQIKQAGPCDAAVIETLAEQVWAQHYTPIIGKAQVDYMLAKFQSERAIKADIETGYIYTIAYLDDVACGYSAVKIDRGVFLSKFYVLQRERGKGIGKTLMDNIIAIAGQHKRPRIWLTCNKHNPSLSVYKKMNFIIIDEVVTDIGGGYVMDDYVLEKKL